MDNIVVNPGSPFPLGATPCEDGSVNFAVVSQSATSVTLCLFADSENPTLETERIRLTGRRNDVWHISVSGIPEGCTYGYRVDGPWEPAAGLFFNHRKLLLDPYAKQIDGPSLYHESLPSLNPARGQSRVDSGKHAPRAFVPRIDSYDWEGDKSPNRPLADSVIMEMHVKGFSKLNESLPEEIRGTYAGLAHPASIAYLKEIGITSVQLLPVHQHLDDGFLLERDLVNYWGYNTLGFFAPEARYASTDDAVTEFRDMVKALHKEGLEVILDVVYNHTCEAGVDGPTCMLRGFDNLHYYHTGPTQHGNYVDFTGCGNSVDVSHPQSLRLILDSLRYWVEEMHVDGFRFDLAVELGRYRNGYKRRAAFFQAIHQDPVLNQVKMIAEPWDLGSGGYQIGNFPHDWYELNGKFRDTVRSFWKGDPGLAGEFAQRLTGSEDLFAHNRRTAEASVNMITSHDGFTLHDLVSYNQKHNEANGENNADGDTNNHSYNHGVEGPTKDKKILKLRHQQVRNFLTTTICSKGVPFILAGDERLRSQGGNNNTYCQDNELNWISWNDSEESKAMQQFVKRVLQFRADRPLLRKMEFFTGKGADKNSLPDVCWLRPDGNVKQIIDWNVEIPGAFSALLHSEQSGGSILMRFNARNADVEFEFPDIKNVDWKLVADTAKPELFGDVGKNAARKTVLSKSMQIWETVDA